jgi:putative tryptophan/tyrosine transport system substrate-binding protein
MTRRLIGLLVTLALCLLVAPLAAEPQLVGKVAQLGIRVNAPWPPLEMFRQALRELGYAEGQNLAVVYRWAQGRAEQFPAPAAELVQLRAE